MSACTPSWASSKTARATMLANRSRDTGPELAVRRAVHSLGLRYRVDVRPLPGIRRTADLVFRPARVAVFVDGCFWHGCPDHSTRPGGPTMTHCLDRTRWRGRNGQIHARRSACGQAIMEAARVGGRQAL